MKKIYLIFTAVFISLMLTACNDDTPVIDIPVEEVDDPVVEDPQEEPDDDDVTCEPCEPVVVEVAVPVYIQPEMERKYKPGVYFETNQVANGNGGYSFAVVVIDAYGDIAGVYIDETYSSRKLYTDSENVYVYVEGNGETIPSSYRKIDINLEYSDYPTGDEAITTDDLIVGIHSDSIDELDILQVNESKYLLNGNLNMGGTYTYKNQIDMIANKIISDNTTYGFNLYNSGDLALTDSIAGVSIAVSEYLELVQTILNDKAVLTESDFLLSKEDPVYGMYETGSYINRSDRIVEDGAVNFDFSFIVVDDYGMISGCYLDGTSSDSIVEGGFSTKNIMGKTYGMSTLENTKEWNEQALLLATQVANNQGIKGISLYSIDATQTIVETELGDERQEIYTDVVAGVTIRVDGMLQAVNRTLEEIKYSNYVDGTYYQTSNTANHIFGVLTIEEGQIEHLFLDKVKSVFQASHEHLGEERKVFKFVRNFEMGEDYQTKTIVVYQVGGKYYSIDDVHYIDTTVISERDQIDKDDLVNLSDIELETIVPVPGYYTAHIADDSEYINMEGWLNKSEEIALNAALNNGTDFLHVDEYGLTIGEDPTFNTKTIIELINKLLYSARTGGNQLTNSIGSNLSNKLADGEYFYHGVPDEFGYIDFAYMTVDEGDISSLFFDTTFFNGSFATTQFADNFNNDVGNTEILNLVNVLIRQQGTLVNNIIDSYDYVNTETLGSINDSILLEVEGLPLEKDKYIDMYEVLVIQAADQRLQYDAELIYEAIGQDETLLKDAYFIIDTTTYNYLPKEITGVDVSNDYQLRWRSQDTRAIDIKLHDSEEGYNVEVDDDVDSGDIVMFKLEVVLEETNKVIDAFYYPVDVLSNRALGFKVLNDPSFTLQASYLLESTEFDLPTSDKVTILWDSSDESAFDDGQSRNINSDKEIILTAYADLNEDGVFTLGEPSKEFNVTILTEESGIERVRDAISLSNVYKYIDKDIVLSKKSPVWGITYDWITYSDFVTLTDYGTYEYATVTRKDYDIDVKFIADLSIGTFVNDLEFEYKILAGNKNVYREYAEEDAAALQFCHLELFDPANPSITYMDLNKLVLDNRIGIVVDGECQEIVIDRFNDYNEGIHRESKIKFEIDDFKMFVDSDGFVIYEHPTKDAEFTLNATITYSGGLVNGVVEKSWPITIISQDTQERITNEDLELLSDYLIDISHNQGADYNIVLPLFGKINDLPIVWSLNAPDTTILDTMYDVTDLENGRVIILTKTGEDELLDGQKLVLTATITLGGFTETKDISIVLKD